MRDLFYSLPKNILHCFQGRNILWHFLAIALTGIIVVSGFDWVYFVHAQNSALRSWFFPAVLLGGLIPIFLPMILLVIGWRGKSLRIKNSGLAVAQAAMVGFFISSFYKAFTGRVHPPRLAERAVDISHQFRFGFLQGGIFWGWPSSHTTIAFALAVTLIVLYPKKKIFHVLILAYAVYIGLGVSVSIHWFSEAVAGAIIGSVIGGVVGTYFSERYVATGEGGGHEALISKT